MDWARAKTILIFILVGVNVILGGILLLRRWEVSGAQARRLEAMTDVLEQLGYELPDGQLPGSGAAVLDIKRDTAAEQAVAAALLRGIPEIRLLSTDGTSIEYAFPAGTATFRTGGQFDFLLDLPVPKDEVSGRFFRWLRDIGYWQEEREPELVPTDGGYAVYSYRRGLRVWDEALLVTLSEDGAVTALEGRWQIGRVAQSPSGASNSAEWALLALAEYLRLHGETPGKVLGMELGYRSEIITSDITRLTPYWRVALESGSYYVDSLSGACEPVYAAAPAA